MLFQARKCGLGEAAGTQADGTVEAFQQLQSEAWNLSAAGAERRQLDLRNLQTIKEICAKTALLNASRPGAATEDETEAMGL